MRHESVASAVFTVATAVGGIAGWHPAVIIGTAIIACVLALDAGYPHGHGKEDGE
ncbi:hypothetical protein ACLUWO_04110 [Pseudoscardovia radai]|uniref:hypothetical protein n=1 Tax=Pseudoscardovia radai TaxID=987066 RepID=UPI003993B4F2